MGGARNELRNILRGQISELRRELRRLEGCRGCSFPPLPLNKAQTMQCNYTVDSGVLYSVAKLNGPSSVLLYEEQWTIGAVTCCLPIYTEACVTCAGPDQRHSVHAATRGLFRFRCGARIAHRRLGGRRGVGRHRSHFPTAKRGHLCCFGAGHNSRRRNSLIALHLDALASANSKGEGPASARHAGG